MMMIRVLATDARRFFAGQVLDPLIRLEVVLHPEDFVLGIHPLVGVRAETIDIAIARGNATITEQPGELMRRFG